nr:immunoglobulin heavy chain junction region [Mus musculus]
CASYYYGSSYFDYW